MIKLISKAITSWIAWRTSRRLARVMPEIPLRKKKIAALRMSHKSTRVVIAEQKRDIHAALRAK